MDRAIILIPKKKKKYKMLLFPHHMLNTRLEPEGIHSGTPGFSQIHDTNSCIMQYYRACNSLYAPRCFCCNPHWPSPLDGFGVSGCRVMGTYYSLVRNYLSHTVQAIIAFIA